MNYIYETHLHTVEASACGKVPGKDYITYMQDLGYAGIIVTDHFFNGNSRVPKDLPWEDRVEQYCSGFEHAYAAAAGTDFTVMFGIEYNFDGDEFLLYGVDKKWLLSNPHIMDQTRAEVYATVHEGGGIMIQAHPYRERDYLSAIHLTPDVCDGAEVYNAANPDYQNALAFEYAAERDFRMSAGSDIHYFNPKALGGMMFDHPITSIKEYKNAFLNREGIPVCMRDLTAEDRHFVPVSNYPELLKTWEKPTLPVIWH